MPSPPSQVLVHPDDTFLVLACDGVWDLVSSQQVVSYVHRRLLKHRDVQRASREVISCHVVCGAVLCVLLYDVLL